MGDGRTCGQADERDPGPGCCCESPELCWTERATTARRIICAGASCISVRFVLSEANLRFVGLGFVSFLVMGFIWVGTGHIGRQAMGFQYQRVICVRLNQG